MTARKQLTATKQHRIRQMVRSGRSIGDIANQCRAQFVDIIPIHTANLRSFRKPKATATGLSPRKAEVVRKQRAAGVKLDTLMADYNLTKSELLHILRTKPAQKLDPISAAAAQMLAEGFSLAEVKANFSL